MTWPDASNMCSALGGSLVEIHNQEQNLLVKNIVDQHHAVAWMGASDVIKEGTWFWVKSGTPIAGFTDWAPGQPNNRYHHEDCMVFDWSKGQWNDQSCSLKNPFVCQKVAAPAAVVVG